MGRILEAWQRALPDLPNDFWLVMVGAKGSGTVFQSAGFATASERVLMPGYVEDRHLLGLYAGARGLVYPSLAEGFGLPVLEAMACGVPVLTSANSALLEVAGNAALLVDPLDVNAIVRCMRALAVDDHLVQRLGQMGLDRASQFSWDRAADQTWKILETELLECR